MQSFKKFLSGLKKKKKKKPEPGKLTSFQYNPSTMQSTNVLPAATSGNQPRLS